jgi:hypothetical protein
MALRQAQVKNTQEKVNTGKYSPKISNPTTPTPSPQTTKSPIEEISHLLDNRPIDAYVEMKRRLFTSAPTLPSEAGRSQTALKIIVHIVAEYGSTA